MTSASKAWKELGRALEMRGGGGAELVSLFFRLREHARSLPSYIESDWKALGDSLGFHDG